MERKGLTMQRPARVQALCSGLGSAAGAGHARCAGSPRSSLDEVQGMAGALRALMYTPRGVREAAAGWGTACACTKTTGRVGAEGEEGALRRTRDKEGRPGRAATGEGRGAAGLEGLEVVDVAPGGVPTRVVGAATGEVLALAGDGCLDGDPWRVGVETVCLAGLGMRVGERVGAAPMPRANESGVLQAS